MNRVKLSTEHRCTSAQGREEGRKVEGRAHVLSTDVLYKMSSVTE